MSVHRLLAAALALLPVAPAPGLASSAEPEREYRWTPLAFPAASWKHDDAFFLDDRTGWVGTNRGEIHRTDDGGETWRLQFAGEDRPYFRCIAFADASLGFACNLKAEERHDPLYRTTDGGETWSRVAMDPSVPGLCGIAIASPAVVFAAGKYTGPARVVRSVDRGETWSLLDVAEHLGQAVDVHFWNEREGLVVGGSSATRAESRVVVLATEDGGQTWLPRYRGPRDGEWGWKISFPSRSVGYVSIDSAGVQDIDVEYFLKSVDGGRTWERRPFYAGRYRAQGIGFVDEAVGWIGSFHRDRPSLVTRDGGATWSDAGFGDRVNRFRFTGRGGVAAGHLLYWMERRPPSPGDPRGPGAD